MKRKSLFKGLPSDCPDELVDILASGEGVRIERIVSTGHRSPPEFWYDQEEAEWVVVLRGRALLLFMDPPGRVELGPGDFVNIPPHRRHRVESTAENEPTVWLAVFYKSSSPEV